MSTDFNIKLSTTKTPLTIATPPYLYCSYLPTYPTNNKKQQGTIDNNQYLSRRVF